MTSAETLALLFIGFPLLILAITFALNIPFYRRLVTAASPSPAPFVSILIPARNESAVIAQTVRSHLATDYPNLELILLDDNSDDDTNQVALSAANKDSRFRLLSGAPLPAGWLGKNWACHQLASAASGDILIFTDADVVWHQNALASITHELSKTQADLLSVFPTQITESWGERLTVPLMAHAILAYLPLVALNYVPLAAFAAANGQCMAFRRPTYNAIGGHDAVKAAIVEDVKLAQLIKKQGHRLRIADGNSLISCRMYQNWQEVRNGFAKNILAGHLNSLTFLTISTIFHLTLFVGPLLWAGIKLLNDGDWSIPLLLWLATVVLRAASAALTRQRMRDAFLMPISVMMMSQIALQSVRWKLKGKTSWKGRIVG